MSGVEESRGDVMLSDASPASPACGLGSPIATLLINIEGDGDVFARFMCFPSDGVVNLTTKPPQAEKSRDHRVRTQRCVRSLGPFRSPLPYNLKTGLLLRSLVVKGKHRKESSLFKEGRSELPVVRSDDEEDVEAFWDQFYETYSFKEADPSEGEATLAGKSLGGGGSPSG